MSPNNNNYFVIIIRIFSASRVGRKNIPILGINTGRLGFLADVASENILLALETIISKEYTIEERSLLQVEARDGTPFGYSCKVYDRR